MRISGEGKIGIALGLLALGGAGALSVFPDQLLIGWSMMGVAAVGGVALALHHFEIFTNRIREVPVLVLIGTALIIAGGITGMVGAMKIDAAANKQSAPNQYFRFEKRAFIDTKFIRWPDGSESGLTESRYFLLVGNRMDTGHQLKNVKARIFFMGQEPLLARVKETGELSTDIRHGEWAFFEVGKMVSYESRFPSSGAIVYNEYEKKQYEYLRPEHPRRLEILLPSGKTAYGINQDLEQPASDWPMWMVVTADDAISLQLKLVLDMTSKTPIIFEEEK